MPTYTMKNVETGETKDMFLKISEKEELQAKGVWKQIHTSPASLVTHTGNIVNKTSGDWKNHLERIKRSSGSRVQNSVNI